MKLVKRLATFSALSIFLSGCITVHASSIDVEKTETLTLSTSGLELLDIDATAGFLKVEGSDGSEIEVVAELAVVEGHYNLKLDKRGDNARLLADANTDSFSSWFGNSPKIDLTVRMPKNLALKVRDGSGFIEIRNINGSVKIKDGSGGLEIENLQGDLVIDDGSGDMDLANIGGNIVIDDGSGSIKLTKAKGDVEIEDGSGNITLAGIGGKVEVDDGSGNLEIDDAQGHVTIDDGSGSIDVDTLMNGLTVVNSGSGGLSIKNVKGDIVTD